MTAAAHGRTSSLALDSALSNPDAQPPLQLLLTHWPGVLFRQRPDLVFESVTPQIAGLTGVSKEDWEREPDMLWNVIHQADIDEFQKQLERAQVTPEGVTSTFRIRHATTGRVAYVLEFRRALHDSRGKLRAYEGVWQDVTRQSISERRLAAASWKETLAVLTMGLAHDFNNVMSGILALSESFLTQVDAEHPFHEGLTLIRNNTLQAAELIHRIVNLHHGRAGNRAYQNLNELAADTVDLLKKVIPSRITVEAILDREQLAIFVDAVELRQLMINMALNAVDAMPEPGRLLFHTSLHRTLPSTAHFQGTMPRVPAVCLAVSDTGTGIKGEHLASIFEPFFTTKARNKGCGLGLYNARVFVEKHHGAISVESAEKVGTTFRVWLPQADFTEVDTEVEVLSRRRRSLVIAGRQRRALESMAELLREHNFQVVVAEAGVEDLLESEEYQFDGLLLQVEPNDTSFLRLAARIRRQRTPVKLIFQIIGCNQDELDTQHLLRADLVLSEELPEIDVLRKITAVLEAPLPGLP